MKMPALQFYPADWRKDPGVQSLGYFDRGVWFEMLCMMHESEQRGVLLLNGQPMPEDALANALGLDNQILSSTLTKLLTYGVAKRRQEDGAIFNKRMVEDEKLCKIRREAGKKGGNPILLNQNLTTQVNQKSTPSSSSSSSSSPSKSKEKSKDLSAHAARTIGTRLPADWVLPKTWGDWALQERTELTAADIRLMADTFKDHFIANANRAVAKKADWLATWRNWVRNQKITKPNGKGNEAPWWSSNESMIAKGDELGLSPRAGESWGDFKGRIQSKISNHQGSLS